MIKRLLFILVFTTHIAFSQGEADHWYFGNAAGISFNNGDPVNISGPSIKINTYEGCSSISDADGNLLFYSDGSKVWNASHGVMPNGSNLLGHPSSTQSAMIIPKPKSTSIYYVFTVGSRYEDGIPGFNYYTIDMNADNGKGDVIAGPTNLSGALSLVWTEKVAAVQGGECHTYWVVSHDGTNLKSYKVDENGVNPIPVISFAPAPEEDIRGYLKISPDGKKLAIARFVYKTQLLTEPVQGGDSSVLLYDFNDLTGEATNGIRIFDDPNDRIHPYGIEFSRQSTKLYISTMTEQIVATDKLYNSVYQYDLENPDIPSSEIEIKKQLGFRGALQLGPNGKIYATTPLAYRFGTAFLDVINHPEELGINCGYEEDAVFLGTGMATQGLPPFIASIFSPIEITRDDSNGNPISLNGQSIHLCTGDNLTISPEPLTGNVTYEWTFNGTVISSTENLDLTNIDSNSIGDYKLEASSMDACDRIIYKQAYFTIESISPPPYANPVINSPICDDNYTGTYEINLNDSFSQTILDGQDPSVFEVIYFATSLDAENNENPLPTPYNSLNTTIFARVQNIGNNNCYATTSFDVEIYQSALPIEAGSIESIKECDNTSVGTETDGLVLFDLEIHKMELLKNQSESEFSITYYTDDGYLNAIQNPSSFENTVPGGQRIYVRKTNNLEANCYTDTSFAIEVLPVPDIEPAITFKNCDEDGLSDGFTTFNLNEADEIITKGPTDYNVTYHLSSTDANNGDNPLNASSFNNSTSNLIYARIVTLEGCYKVSTVDLQVSATSFPSDYLKVLESCDDDDQIDGLHLFDLTVASAEFMSLFPTGSSPLSISFYRSQNEALLEQNKISSPSSYMSESAYNQLIYVRVESEDNGDCVGIGPYLNLIVHPRPEFDVDPNASVCVEEGTVILETYNALDSYSYEWYNPSNILIGTDSFVEVSLSGDYTVVATSGLNCASFTQKITVNESDVAIITEQNVTISDDSSNNTISINNTGQNLGLGDYEFSLDDEFGPFQDEPYFDQVLPGIHTIFVRDKNNCGTSSLEVSVLGFPKFFTPNNDGHNDYWKVLGVNEYFYPTSLIYIFDRYGKILAKVNPLSHGWDGNYNGTELPSDDYWFSVELKDSNGVVRNKKGNFSMIRK